MKLKTILISAALVAATSATLAAPFGENTAEQKATQAVEDNLNELAQMVNKNCGTSITVKVDWKAYTPVYNSFSTDERENRSLDNIYSVVSSQSDGHIRDIASYCKDEPIFKANVAKKLKSIVVQPSNQKDVSAKQPSHVFKLNNGVLSITHHLFRSNTSSDTARKLF
jgi:hypothetical protein